MKLNQEKYPKMKVDLYFKCNNLAACDSNLNWFKIDLPNIRSEIILRYV